MVDAATDFYSRISDDISVSERFGLFHAYAENLGFSDAFYARKVFDPDDPARVIMFKQWDPEWLEIYEAKRYGRIDWSLKAARNRQTAFGFERPDYELSKPEREFVKEARHHKRLNGFALPFRGALGTVAGFSVTGSIKPPTAEQMNRVTAAGQLLDLVMRSGAAAMSAKAAGLSFREVKLVQFLCEGYNMVQIAHTVGSSEQWIRKSFMQIRGKLRVGSNPELVLKAHALNLIG